jgi:hypothetical protein
LGFPTGWLSTTHKDSLLPRQLHTIKRSSDLGASISIMPRKIYDMLGLPPLENCYFDVLLADVAKKKPLEGLMMFLLWLTITLFLLISLVWMLNAMLHVLLFWEDLFLEQLVPSLI